MYVIVSEELLGLNFEKPVINLDTSLHSPFQLQTVVRRVRRVQIRQQREPTTKLLEAFCARASAVTVGSTPYAHGNVSTLSIKGEVNATGLWWRVNQQNLTNIRYQNGM